MAALEGGANYKTTGTGDGTNLRISGNELIHNSNSNFATFLVESLGNKIPFKMYTAAQRPCSGSCC